MANYLEIILKEMCIRVGADYDKINFTKDGWYSRHSWTEDEQDSFNKWLSKYLVNNKKISRVLYGITFRSLKSTKKAVDMFSLCYGWKIKE